MSLAFDEIYYKENNLIEDSPKYLLRAKFIRDVLKTKKVIVLGGGVGYLAKYLNEMDIVAYSLDRSDYAYENRVSPYHVKDDIKNLYTYQFFQEADLIVSWSVLDCLRDNIDAKISSGVLNEFKGEQLHIFSCSENSNSEKYIKDGYFIQSHDYWKSLLPKANLVCWDCKKVVQGTLTKVPLMQDWVTD